MKFQYLSPRNITLTEYLDNVPIIGTADGGIIEVDFEHYWKATHDGSSFNHDGTFATGVGPDVYMERHGKTADEAYQNLVNALTEQGWSMRQ